MIDSGHTTCDVCAAVKGATNHWFVAIQVPGLSGIMFVPAEDAIADRRSAARIVEDLCGQACATKRFSQYLSTLK